MDPRQIAIEKKRRTVSVKSRLDDTCAICLNDMQSKTVTHLPCGHSIHLSCFQKLQQSHLSSKHKCPTCRTTYENGPLDTLDDVLNMILQAADDRAIFDVLSDPHVEVILNRSGIDTS